MDINKIKSLSAGQKAQLKQQVLDEINRRIAEVESPSLDKLKNNIDTAYGNMQDSIKEQEAYKKEQEAKPTVTESLFPSLSRGAKEGQSIPMNVFSGANDLLGVPTRAVATLRGQKFSDENANIWRPEMEKLKEKTPDWANLPIEIIGGMAGDPTGLLGGIAKGGAKAVSGLAKGGRKILGKSAETLSGVPESALVTYGKGGDAKALIKAEAGNKEKLIEDVLNKFDEVATSEAERGAVAEAFTKMPDMNFNKTKDALRNAKIQKAGTDEAIAFNEAIDRQIAHLDRLEGKTVDFPEVNTNNTGLDFQGGVQSERPFAKVTTSNTITAKDFYDIRKQIDDKITGWGNDLGDIAKKNKMLMNVRKVMKEELLEQAPKEYKDAMEQWHKNLEIVDNLKSYIGKNEATRDKKIESFLSNILNKNKGDAQDKLKALDPELYKRAEASAMADALGLTDKQKIPDLLSRKVTGGGVGPQIGTMLNLAGTTGAVGGAMTGNPLAILAGLASATVPSPLIMSKVLGTMDKVGDVKNAVKNITPKQLESLQKVLSTLSYARNTTNPIFNTFNSNERR